MADHAYDTARFMATWTDRHGNKYQQAVVPGNGETLADHFAWVIDNHIITEYRLTTI